jgi:hypothetical protein
MSDLRHRPVLLLLLLVKEHDGVDGGFRAMMPRGLSLETLL